jgi:hypothetical protein
MTFATVLDIHSDAFYALLGLVATSAAALVSYLWQHATVFVHVYSECRRKLRIILAFQVPCCTQLQVHNQLQYS